MPRPSRNVDQLLLKAGHELLPTTGIRGLSLRHVAERAQVNLGMFHYHFKSKDVFIRALLEQKYNDMFAGLEIAAHAGRTIEENLRAAATLLARFGRDNRALFVKLVGDALNGEAVAAEFLRANMPRHVAVVASLIAQGQAAGLFRPMPPHQALAFFAGAVGAPILLGAALAGSGQLPPAAAVALEQFIFSDEAIATRIDMAVAGLRMPPPAPPATPRGRKK